MTAGRVLVLMYHRVGRADNAWERRYCVSPERFAQHMDALREEGLRAVSLQEFRGWLDGGASLPDGSFLLTFDDGFLGVHEHAAPVLSRLGWPATVFLVSGLLGGRDDWTRAENPSGATHPLMAAHHVRELNGRAFAFHSHTRSHRDLTTLAPVELADELRGSRIALEDMLGEAVDCVAYPFGRYNERVIDAARAAGYRTGFSTQPGFNRHGIDRFRIRRLDVFGTDTPAVLLRKVRLGSNDGSLSSVVRYYGGRLAERAGLRRAAASGS
jgi:peptidoglycan/xylan/chitin deacetylase (PgdA/CDA1 family)